MKKSIKKPIVIILIIILLGLIIYYLWGAHQKELSYDFIIIQKTNLIQEVNVTGRVKPATEMNLGFEKNGKVAQIYVKVGDRVKKEEKLISLNNSDLAVQLLQVNAELGGAKAQLKSSQANKESILAQLTQSQASLEAEQAKLDEFKAGTREEEIKIAETKVAKTEKALEDAEINLENIKNKADDDLLVLYEEIDDILNDAYTKAGDAVNTQIDEFFSNDFSDNPQLTFQTSDFQAEVDSEAQRVITGSSIGKITKIISGLTSDHDNLDNSLKETKENLIIIRDFLIRLYDTVQSGIGLTQSSINTYKANINTAQTNINTAIFNINTQQQDIASQKITNDYNISVAEASVNEAESALISAQDELALKKAGYTLEQITAQEAMVKKAEANLLSQESLVKQAEANVENLEAQIKKAEANIQNIRVQLSKTILIAPRDGIITKQEVGLGEIVAANVPIVSLISEAEFEIEANIPEVDIAKVKVNDLAKVTLDAYGSDVIFQARVVRIAPRETIIEGVSAYKTTLQFLEEDQRIKSGMTANLDILTAKKNNVISIPQRAILDKNGEKIVRILDKDIIKEVKVETGLRDSVGNIEIIKGVEEGYKVIIFMEE